MKNQRIGPNILEMDIWILLILI
jgi:hypothetical protein